MAYLSNDTLRALIAAFLRGMAILGKNDYYTLESAITEANEIVKRS